MVISYDKLWKLMIDLKLNKTELRKLAGLSTNVIAKLGKNDHVSMETIERLCMALNCNIGDVVDFINEPDQLRINNYVFGNDHYQLMVAEKSDI